VGAGNTSEKVENGTLTAFNSQLDNEMTKQPPSKKVGLKEAPTRGIKAIKNYELEICYE
jgi:hypothetical protein